MFVCFSISPYTTVSITKKNKKQNIKHFPTGPNSLSSNFQFNIQKAKYPPNIPYTLILAPTELTCGYTIIEKRLPNNPDAKYIIVYFNVPRSFSVKAPKISKPKQLDNI